MNIGLKDEFPYGPIDVKFFILYMEEAIFN